MEQPSNRASGGWRARLRTPFAWVDNGLDWFERTALVVCILTMAAVSVANVISRNTLGSSLLFANDVAQMLLVIVTFMGIGIGARQARHIRVSAIHDQLPAGARKGLLIVIGFSTSALLFALAGYAWDYAGSAQRSCRVLPDYLELGVVSLPLGAMPLAVGVIVTLVVLALCGHGVRLARQAGRAGLKRLPSVWRKPALALAVIVVGLLAAWLFGQFLELVDNRVGRCRITSSTGFPVYLVYMVVPLGFLLGSIQFFLAGLRNVLGRTNWLSWYRRDEYDTAESGQRPEEMNRHA